MADRAVACAVEKLGVIITQEAMFLSGVRTDFEWLQSQLRWMESFMRDADARRRRNEDERMKTWVREVKDVAHQAEDIVDTFMLRIERRGGPIKEFFRRYACIPSDLKALHGIGNEILQIKLKIQSIQETRHALGIPNLGESSRESSSASFHRRLQAWRQTSHHLDDDTVVVGFNDSNEFILKRLLESGVKRRCVISVVGMGGMGKTTLAAKIFNSNEVKSHFRTCAWITVSQEYTVKNLLMNITTEVMGATLTKQELEKVEEDRLKSRLYDFLKQRRYFIVLDDIWDQEVWEQIKAAFPNERNGSRLLITTRFIDVAKSADPRMSPYQMPFLSQEQSWQLFLTKAVFPSELDPEVISSCPKDLVELGRVLVKRCGGLPLAVVVLGGLLSIVDPTINAWRAVAENLNWESTDRGKICLEILALSYNCLPHHSLKSCFLYLGCFPEDYQYKASELIRLWVAEGFIPHRANQKLEETAEDYLEELVKRCMVTAVDRSEITRKTKTFQIHDLFRELSITEAKEDGLFRICNNKGDSTELDNTVSRRLVISKDVPSNSDFPDRFQNSEFKARSLLGFSSVSYDIFLQNMSPGFTFLRVLHLSIRPACVPGPATLYEEISSLIHLRYICLSSTDLRKLPSSIGKLCNLQTLDLRKTGVVNPPKTITVIQPLRHLYLRVGVPLYESSLPLGRLRNLQTLKGIKAGPWIHTELAKLSNIRRLRIYGVSVNHVSSLSDSLRILHHLASLFLYADKKTSAASLFSSLSRHQHIVKLTLSGQWFDICQLPRNLIKLSLQICEIDEEVIATVEKLPSLVILKVKGRLPQQMVFSAGGFPQLQDMHIEPTTHTEWEPRWKIEIGAAPNLTNLKIDNSMELKMLPDGLEHVGSLQKLVLQNADYAFWQRLTSTREDLHKIRHASSVLINGIPLHMGCDDKGYTLGRAGPEQTKKIKEIYANVNTSTFEVESEEGGREQRSDQHVESAAPRAGFEELSLL